MLQGYTLTGRTGLFPSYEAFLGIVHTMMVQYSKFIKMVLITFPTLLFLVLITFLI
jgi:xylulose-5-phosphate/fructose-6-phosphate phosphoketolase